MVFAYFALFWDEFKMPRVYMFKAQENVNILLMSSKRWR